MSKQSGDTADNGLNYRTGRQGMTEIISGTDSQ